MKKNKFIEALEKERLKRLGKVVNKEDVEEKDVKSKPRKKKTPKKKKS